MSNLIKSEFIKCKKCKFTFSSIELEDNLFICPKCGNYMDMPSYARISLIADENSFESLFDDVLFDNTIDFPGYVKTHMLSSIKNDLEEAVITGKAKLNGMPFLLGVMDSRFMMASMGRVVGEKITRLMELAASERLPLVLVTASGGARMQEGIISLMQMAKTSGGTAKMDAAKVPYIVVMTNPTSGGVTASFAMLGDVILSEPNALICFAGPRVVKETTKKELPKGFQRAESLLEHGFIDAIVKRDELKDVLYRLLSFMSRKEEG